MSKVPIASLPLPGLLDRLCQVLVPDPSIPSIHAFHETLRERPSIQRRSRVIAASSHFSYTTPFPTPFPYQIPNTQNEDEDAAIRNIETWLVNHGPSKEQSKITVSGSGPLLSSNQTGNGLVKLSSDSNKFVQRRNLLALSSGCVIDCLPSLDVGDAFELLQSPQNSNIIETEGNQASNQKFGARRELVDVLSGQTILVSPISNINDSEGYAPWSLRYCGHQFGVWAGQLGDGRAISIIETPHPTKVDTSYEVQLKGAGRTPFSRSADGLAVLRSSIREFLGAEAINALGIPTTRSLSLISLPDITVVRERMEKSSIVSRVATSFIRIGSFEAHNPPDSTLVYMFTSAGGKSVNTTDWESLRILGEWVSRRVLKLDLKPEQPWGIKLVLECACRSARMVAGWQAYGFMHGVMNTDNISICGLTMDYGPYAFMDIYNYNHICNHTDEEGRYSYKLQPTMIIYALKALLRSLSPLIGAEHETGHAVKTDWATNVDSATLTRWGEDGQGNSEALETEIMSVFDTEYHLIMRKRLGLKGNKLSDKHLLKSLLDHLQMYEVDYHSTFRHLSTFRPSILDDQQGTVAFIARLNEYVVDSKKDASNTSWQKWLQEFAQRIDEDKDNWSVYENWELAREESMLAANPRFVLRQWVLEDIIAECEAAEANGDLARSRTIIAKMLEMSVNPFRRWGGEGKPYSDLDDNDREERRLCGLGARDMLGFQCSCSS